MPLTGKYTERFQTFFSELKHYLELQKSYVAMDTAEKLTIILSAVAIAAISLVTVAMFLFFASFAIAYWIGQVTGCIAIGFLSIAAVLLFALIVFYIKRRDWITMPLARFMIRLFVREENTNGNGN